MGFRLKDSDAILLVQGPACLILAGYHMVVHLLTLPLYDSAKLLLYVSQALGACHVYCLCTPG